MASILFGDFETRSACDIRVAGADVYARHPTTDVLCFGYAFDDEPVQLWRPGLPPPKRVLDHVKAGGTFVGHNSAFELVIWNEVMVPRYGWPRLNVEQVECTMVRAYAMGLPGSLEKASAAVGIPEGKDMAGNRVMLYLSKPKVSRVWETAGEEKFHIEWHDELEEIEKFVQLYDYCKKDVEVERELHRRLLRLPPKERKIYALDHKINQRGVRIDAVAARKAMEIVEYEKDKANLEIRRLTDGAVFTFSAVGQLVDYCKSKGLPVRSVAKADVTELLQRDDLEPTVRQVLQLRQEASKSSTAKLKAMIEGLCPDGRVRGLFQYYGAGTGRWAGRRVQLQNLPRGKLTFEEIEGVFQILHSRSTPAQMASLIEMLYGPPMSVLSDCLRSFIIPDPGKRFLVADYSSIEARVLAWLAGQEDVLDAFRKGEDLYKIAASRIYGVPKDKVTKEQRQIGKVAVLALGYGGGKGAFQAMARGYGVTVSDDEAEQIKKAWRYANQKIEKYWWDCEEAAKRAIRNHGKVFKSGAAGRQVEYLVKGSFLFCKLPSGRVLSYPYPKLVEERAPWDQSQWIEVIYFKGQWTNGSAFEDMKTYGGSLVENITQAVARDLLAEGMLRLEHEVDFEVVAHVHDEIVVEDGTGESRALQLMEDLMCVNSTWAKDLPLGAEGFSTNRYRK